MLGTIVGLIVIGLIAGFVARALVPGKDDFTVPQTILLGIVGSFIGGFLGYLISHDSDGGFVQTSSWLGSIVGAVIALLVYNRATGRKRVRR